MAILKCKMCGGQLDINNGQTVVECEYCGTKQTVPTLDNEKKVTLFTRANRLRSNCEFDKAYSVYESIVADFPEEAEAYWGLVLCKYGIEYVDDPLTGKKIPTCHRTSFESVMDDNNYDMTLEYADSVARAVYREEAKIIEELRKGIIEVSSKEDPYDIFICYKETDDNGERTIDSVLAQDIYDALIDKGYKVFFSRITLEDKLGVEYEPYIFAALNSAKVMLVFGTSYDYYNAVWVKNEWSRFLSLIAHDKTKHLIPCFKGIDAYDMPKEFAKLQAQDLGKVGATQDLLRGIEKIIGKNKSKVIIQSETDMINALLKRGNIYLSEGNYFEARKAFEKVVDFDCDNCDGYLGKLLSDCQVKNIDDLASLTLPFNQNDAYLKLIQLGDEKLVKRLKEISSNVSNNYFYNQALQKIEIDTLSDYIDAKQILEGILDYKDANSLYKTCIDKIEELNDKTLKKKKNTKRLFVVAFAIVIISVISSLCYENIIVPNKAYNKAISLLESSRYELAREAFEEMDGYKDSETMIDESYYLEAIEYKNEKKYEKAIDIFTKHTSYKDSWDLLIETKYEYGLSLMNSKKYDKAKEIFSSIITYKSDYKDARTKVDECMTLSLSSANVGGTIAFGKYNWRVLAKEDDKLFIITMSSIGNMQYHDVDNVPVTWETSSIRRYLNSTFYNSFTEKEKELICSSTVNVRKHPYNNERTYGSQTTDYVFLLDAYEADQYFSGDSGRRAGIEDDWFLRSLHNYETVHRVSDDGKIADYDNVGGGYAVYVTNVTQTCAIRPAMWISINNTAD